ncbi:hypothetical protein [Streptomyces sp. M92]|uniref:hypothetical protein n=1 Tax=Streptomyces sp. M92 TaxID=2944250 RepID=UPI00234BC33E|nr:hypothetical protein [Streptomyces sp. M92]WCN05061.1 hypothetical protein M6G08_24705 [Streptomyces sp. M92]
MEPVPPLYETLERLEALITEHGLDRTDLLDPAKLAAQTALPEDAVRVLLAGGSLPADTVNDRARARISTLATAYLRATGRRMSDLASELHLRLGVSEIWARQICDGKKVPNLEFLHGLVKFFDIEGGEAFFTAPADETLNRVLLSTLRRLESDPVQALLDRYGVRGTDLRAHGSMTRRQLERLLEGVFRSVLPEEGEDNRR